MARDDDKQWWIVGYYRGEIFVPLEGRSLYCAAGKNEAILSAFRDNREFKEAERLSAIAAGYCLQEAVRRRDSLAAIAARVKED